MATSTVEMYVEEYEVLKKMRASLDKIIDVYDNDQPLGDVVTEEVLKYLDSPEDVVSISIEEYRALQRADMFFENMVEIYNNETKNPEKLSEEAVSMLKYINED